MFSHIAVCITIYEYRSFMINRKRLRTQRLLEVCFLYDMCVAPIYDKIQLSSLHPLSAQKIGSTGQDEGGPSRQFLTDVFNQLGSLSITHGDLGVKLFEYTSSGWMVITNGPLDDFINNVTNKLDGEKNKEKIKEDLLKRAQDYTRAIGRISKWRIYVLFLRCLASSGFSLPHFVTILLPSVVQCYTPLQMTKSYQVLL